MRRAQILDAAKRAFRIDGLQKTTVDKIAADAGVSVGLLYRFFKSKADIVEAIVGEEVERQDQQAALALADAYGDLDRFAERIAEHLVENPVDHERLALMLEISAEICRNRELQAYILRKRKELSNSVAARIKAKGGDRQSIAQILEKLNLASAVASGLAIHSVIYSDSSYTSPDTVRELIANTIFSRNDG